MKSSTIIENCSAWKLNKYAAFKKQHSDSREVKSDCIPGKRQK